MADFVNFEAAEDSIIDEIDVGDEQIISENVSDVDFIDYENDFDENVEDYYARCRRLLCKILLLILIGLRKQTIIVQLIMVQPKKQFTNLRIPQKRSRTSSKLF